MPIHAGRDEKGFYYQYGQHGKKYYIDRKKPVIESMAEAYRKALTQSRAIEVSRHMVDGYGTRTNYK